MGNIFENIVLLVVGVLAGYIGYPLLKALIRRLSKRVEE